MSTVNGFQVGSETLKYNYESLDNYNTPNFSTSSSKTYAVGDYVMYNGKLYKCTTATTGGTWVSSSWTLAVLSDDVSDLNRQLSVFEDDVFFYTGEYHIKDFLLNRYWVTSGDTIDYTVINSTSSGLISKLIECQPGDIFILNGTGGGNNRLWAFADGDGSSTGNILRKSDANITTSGYKTIIAPAGSTHLIVSFVNASGKLYRGLILKDRVSNLEDVIKNVPDDNATLNSLNIKYRNLFNRDTITFFVYYSAGSTNPSSAHFGSDYIEVTPGKTYAMCYWNGKEWIERSPIVEWYDAGKTYISWRNNAPYQAPNNACYCRVSTLISLLRYNLVFSETDSFTKITNGIIYSQNDTIGIIEEADNSYVYAFGNIICIGDSLTDGLSASSPHILMKQNYPYYLGRRLAAEVENAGDNGSYPSKWYNDHFAQYNYADYDTAVIWLGTNGGLDISEIDTEGTYTNYYKKIIDGIKAQNASIKIFLLTVFVTGQAQSGVAVKDVTTTNTAITEIANNNDCILVDMSDLTSSKHPELRGGVSDTHFSKAGYIYIANRVYHAFRNYINADTYNCDFGIMSKT